MKMGAVTWAYTLRTKSCFACASTESVLHVSLSLSLCTCRHYAVSFCFELRDLADMLCVCVVVCCGFKIALQNAGSFLGTQHNRAMTV